MGARRTRVAALAALLALGAAACEAGSEVAGPALDGARSEDGGWLGSGGRGETGGDGGWLGSGGFAPPPDSVHTGG